MSTESLIGGILDQIDDGVYSDIFLRPGEEARVKTPAGWLPISTLAKGSQPNIHTKEFLVRFVAWTYSTNFSSVRIFAWRLEFT